MGTKIDSTRETESLEKKYHIVQADLSEEEKTKHALACAEAEKELQNSSELQGSIVALELDMVDEKVDRVARVTIYDLMNKTFQVAYAIQQVDHHLHDSLENSIDSSHHLSKTIGSKQRTKAYVTIGCAFGGGLATVIAGVAVNAFSKAPQATPNTGTKAVDATLSQNAYDPTAQLGNFLSTHKDGIQNTAKTIGNALSNSSQPIGSLLDPPITEKQNELQIAIGLKPSSLNNTKKTNDETQTTMSNILSRTMDSNNQAFAVRA